MSDTTAQHRRLAILRHLADSSEYTSNASILIDVMRGLAIPTTEAQMIGTLTWLREQDLIGIIDHGHVVVAIASVRGVEVARGLVEYPGVKRPRPRA